MAWLAHRAVSAHVAWLAAAHAHILRAGHANLLVQVLATPLQGRDRTRRRVVRAPRRLRSTQPTASSEFILNQQPAARMPRTRAAGNVGGTPAPPRWSTSQVRTSRTRPRPCACACPYRPARRSVGLRRMAEAAEASNGSTRVHTTRRLNTQKECSKHAAARTSHSMHAVLLGIYTKQALRSDTVARWSPT